MSNHSDRRKIESILREPLTRSRLLLNSKIRAAQNAENPQPFTLQDLQTFMAGVRVPGADFKKEIVNILEAVQTGVAPQAPNFETPETQLVWGAALAYLLLNPEQLKQWKTPVENGELRASDLWKQVTGTRRAYQELLSHAHHVREALRDKDTKYGWGDPGTGFTYQRQKNVINIDLMQSMIVGFEHARADVYREIGHSLLSVNYTTRMNEIYTEMRPLLKKMQDAQGKGKNKKGKGPKLTDDEYKKLRLLSAEWELRHMMFAAAEENVANRFVSNMAKQMLQDYSVSLNNTAVTFRAVGLTRVPKGQQSDDLTRYMNLCNAVQLSFFQNNALFDNTDDGWFRVGVDPNLIRKTATLAQRPDGQKDDQDGVNHADFKLLRELCGGPDGLENLQPKQHERLYGWGNLMNRVARHDADRKAIIEKIWDLYAEQLIQNILKQANDDIDQQLKDAKDKQKDQEQDGDDQDQDQDGDDGQDQDGDDGQEQEGQSGKPQKGQKGQKGKKGQKQRGKPQGDPDDMDDDDQDGDDQDQDGQDQKDGKKKDKNKKDKSDKKDKGDKGDKQDGDEGEKSDGDDADGQDGDDQDGDDQDGQEQDGQKGKGKDKKESKEGKLGADEDETVPVEGAGDMPAPDIPSEVPADEVDPSAGNDADGDDADGQDGDGQDADGADGDDADGDDSMTQEELEKQLNEMEEAEEGEDADGQDADGDDADGQDGEGEGKKKSKKASKSKKPGRQAGHGDGQKLADLNKQDWTDYQKRINELAGPISRVRKLFKSVQERQVQRKQVKSSNLDILPENGEVKDRFNIEAHRNMTIKKMTGQLEERDLNRFHLDETKFTPTAIDIVLMIDGSGSMAGQNMSVALQAAAIMFEAAAGKDMNMNVYVGIWGNNNPPMIIYPGADRVQVGKAMQAARSGLHSGTDFAPAVRKVAQTIGEQRGKSGTLSGFTHVLIISDGDISDVAKSREMIETMFTYSDKVTFDTAIIGRPGTSMEQMSRSIKGHKPFQDAGVTVGSDPNEIPMAIVGLLLEKVRKCGSFIAVPNSQKRRAMQKAHNKMDPKR